MAPFSILEARTLVKLDPLRKAVGDGGGHGDRDCRCDCAASHTYDVSYQRLHRRYGGDGVWCDRVRCDTLTRRDTRRRLQQGSRDVDGVSENDKKESKWFITQGDGGVYGSPKKVAEDCCRNCMGKHGLEYVLWALSNRPHVRGEPPSTHTRSKNLERCLE